MFKTFSFIIIKTLNEFTFCVSFNLREFEGKVPFQMPYHFHGTSAGNNRLEKTQCSSLMARSRNQIKT